jgi:hypothetical protein
MELTKVERNGIIMKLGTLPRPHDPAETKYALARTAPPPQAANLNEPVSLVSPSFDPRPPIFNQGDMGSCAACSSVLATYTAFNVAAGKRDALMFNPAPVYYEARRKHGWEGEDTGSYVADNLDLLLIDGPLLTPAKPYSDDPLKAWNESAWDDGGVYDYAKAHQPFYQDGMLEYIWLSLKAGFPVVLSSYWPSAWFNPRGGKLPENIPFNPSEGAHAFYIFGYVPGFVLADNTWSSRFASDAATFGHQMRAGGFAIPASYFRKGGPVFEARAVNPEKVVIPEPLPEPKPEPLPDLHARIMKAANAISDSIKREINAAPSDYYKQKARNRHSGAQAVVEAVSKVR